jgi:rfaE bifunctional protein nucleotidyltransferase chain/domain
MMTASERVFDRDALARHLSSLRAGRTVVFTNGCFDILHVGHLRYLEAAKALGDVLVVGVNSDASVRRLNKGPERPVVGESERAEMVAGLKPVDYVVIFNEDTPVETIEVLRPDIHVKGGDYAPDDLPEAATVRGYGGRVVIVPFVPGASTTEILAKVKRR